MTKRLPTAEEKRLWQASNKFTRKKKPEAEEDSPAHSAHPAAESENPSPQRGEDGRGPIRVRGTSPDRPRLNMGEEIKPLSTREAKKQRTAHPKIQAVLDLHGLTKLEAHEEVERFILRQQRVGRRHVAIITGKGRIGEGLLRRELPHWLNDKTLRPAIAHLFHAAERDGGQGVMHVILKAPR